MLFIRGLPGFGGRTGRLAYVAGIVGACVATVLFAAATRGLDPASQAVRQPSTSWAGLAFAVAVFWLLICLDARRLRDAGLSAWWGLFPFAVGAAALPFAGVVDEVARSLSISLLTAGFVVVLAALPPRREASAPSAGGVTA